MRAIDADALYKKLNDIRKEEILLHGRLNNENCCTLSTALFEIDNAPTIELRCEECEAFNKTRLLIPQPERKKGKWIPVCGNKQCNCSVCNEGYDHTFEFIEKWNFCPNCGADMRGDEHDQSK